MAADTDQEDHEPRRRGGIFAFSREVRAEARKVTWATRQEVTISTIMVLIMSVAAAIFFFAVDTLMGLIVRFILGMNS